MAAGIIGSVTEFNYQVEDWTVYSERLEQYFCANKIVEPKIKVATLISLIGTETYKLLRDLSFPQLPKDKEYSELIELLKKQYSSHTSVWSERIKFYRARQTNSESVSEWYARIKSIAVNCQFNNSLETKLLDKFVTGLQNTKICDRLCEESVEKTLEEMLRIALQKETSSFKVNSNEVNQI